MSTDDRGAYAIEDLFAAEYRVSAMAARHLPVALIPLELRAGEHRAGVDLALLAGGVEITGAVSDLSGGPIGHAMVAAVSSMTYEQTPSIETDEAGAFRIWVWPGSIGVVAVADGYTEETEWGVAPGSFELRLTPESSIAGTIIDARTNAPVQDVTVGVSNSAESLPGGRESSDISDEQGRFRIDRLAPDRYFALATSSHGYGRSDGSVAVGFGAHVDGVVVRLHPAVRVEGVVVVAGTPPKPCAKPWVSLSVGPNEDYLWAIGRPDGTVHVDGILPGSYGVSVGCPGYAVVDEPPKLDVHDRDVLGLTWTVTEGATIRGRVRTSTGISLGSVPVSARGTTRGDDTSKPDGSYEIRGLAPGEYSLDVRSDAGVSPNGGWKVEVSGHAIVVEDLVLEPAGAIAGTVTDSNGRPRARVAVLIFVGGDYLQARSGEDGAFRFEHLRAGDYEVTANESGGVFKRQNVLVRAAQTSTVKFVVDEAPGRITGVVIDATGKPIADAFVTAASEADQFAIGQSKFEDQTSRVLTGMDGTFVIARLMPGTYAVRASRAGGGDVIAEHVQLATRLQLQIKPTGSIAGMVRSQGSAPSDTVIQLDDLRTGLSRKERFYRTGGHYHLDDLVAGQFRITGTDGDSEGQMTVELTEGAQLAGVDLVLGAPVTLTGRVIDLVSKTPVPDIAVVASLGGSPKMHTGRSDYEGRFTIDDMPGGQVDLVIGPKDGDYAGANFVRQVASRGTVDLGDLSIVKLRVRRGEPLGWIGVTFAGDVLRIIAIAPNGPAARTELAIGDIVTTVDGVDVSSVGRGPAQSLLLVSAGTAVQLGLARGVTITLVTAAR